jgi:DNA phosphorothioation-associated putative methyltransferase
MSAASPSRTAQEMIMWPIRGLQPVDLGNSFHTALLGNFFEDPFPKLTTACLVDLIGKKVRRTNFTARDNAPILHRKELLLAAEHPQRSRFSALTEALEKKGLFRDNQRIGYQKQWEDRLACHGIRIIDHAIVEGGAAEKATEDQKEIGRHRTAIARDRLSTPMQALARHGLLSSDRSVLDYGCGQGDDVRALQAGGIPVTGWDPHFARNVQLKPADIVNVGFVLNVIEEPRERLQVVRRAFDLSRQCLAVAVMIVGKGDTEGHKEYRDGFLTSRGTFQKYYRQEELKEFLDGALRTEAIAVSPGIFFVFKDKLLEQRFLLDRQRRIQVPLAPNLRPPLDRPTLAERRLEALRPVLERLWRQMLGTGRPLADEEVPPDLLSDIEQQIGSLRRAERLCSTQFDVNELTAAGNARKEDLLVYFGLNLFNGRTRYSTLVPELQRDIKVLFGNASSAFEAARALLFSVGKTEVIEEACRRAVSAGYGHLFEGHSLQINSSRLNRLPAALRCYAGCAAKLYGDVDTADLVKIHIRSGKLTLLFYDDFNTSPLPHLRERVKINMRTQRIDFFQHSSESEGQLLYLKSRYMTSDQDGYNQQKLFDDDLVRLGLFDFSGYGPPAEVLNSGLANVGYVVHGFHLEKTWSSSRVATKRLNSTQDRSAAGS